MDELAEAMARRGKPIGQAAIRYHCRDPRGRLYGIAYQAGTRIWLIPTEAARNFADTWEPYGSLRKQKAGPGSPPDPGPASSPQL